MDGIQVIPISDLLRRRRPISGAVPLLHRPNPPTPPPPSTKTLNPNTPTPSHPKFLKSLPQPSSIIGTLTLPTISNYSPHLCMCFSFSDDSGSLCCDVLEFDCRMISRKIRVLGWNFIPFKHSGGTLEITRWEFLEDFNFGIVDSFRLGSGILHDFGNDCDDKNGQCSVYGVLVSVSPVSLVPCLNERVSGLKDVRGFVLEVSCCDCTVCSVKKFDDLGFGGDSHSFLRADFVYFCGVSSSSHPMFLKLIGNVILLSGLRKKVVYIEKDEARLMFVLTETACLRARHLQQNKDFSVQKGEARVQRKGELGVYIGVVRSIYMQGMFVGLDEDVWLLQTDDSVFLPHSVRVGSIIFVRNVHIMNLRFMWGKMLILGACCKTNINTISFSPLETRCQSVTRSYSLLGKFINSLVFPARLWVLLLVQCLRKKFSGAFSEMEILGTKHKEGLVQTYARSILPSQVLHSRHGVFMDFCKHDSCGTGRNIYHCSLSLAMPFSYLVNNCESLFVKSLLQRNNVLKILEECSQVGHPLFENSLPDQPIRRILPSKDTGVSLLGNLKICPATGRLQFIDVTGSIDAVIPDIPSSWDMSAVYEVMDYHIVLEGKPHTWGQFWVHGDNLFSCGHLFESIPIKRRSELTVYVHFSWRNVCCRHFAIHSDPSAINFSTNLDPGMFHMLCLSHKFPLQPRFHDDLSGKSYLFAEVMVFPWDLNIGLSDGAAILTTAQDDLEKKNQSVFSFKRCKTHQTSSCVDKVGLCSNFEESKEKSCNPPCIFHSLPHKRSANNFSAASPVQFPCTVTGRELHIPRIAVPAVLCFTDGNCDMLCSSIPQKVLLEFNSENFFKYKTLHIGGSYIMKHCAEKCLCDSYHKNSGRSLIITSDTNFLSFSFDFGGATDYMSSSHSTSGNLNGFYHQNELLLNRCSSADCGMVSDADVNVTVDVIGLLEADVRFQALKKLILNLCWKSTDTYSINPQFSHRNTVLGLFDNHGMHSGNGLPEGNLISLRGTVVSLYNSDCCSIRRMPCTGAARVIHQSNKEKEGSIYLLVQSDDHVVQICGCVSKFDFPVGLGPGAVATFHRILAFSGQNNFMLTPVSFISVNSVREIPSPTVTSLCPISEETIASCLLSDLSHCNVGQPRRFRCSIVAVYFVMLERNKSLDKLLSCFQLGTAFVNIPLAGFILDDGSARCCCWTNGERAAKFLRLHEDISWARSGSCLWRLKDAVRSGTFSTPSYQLNQILKKHGKVCVKNYGCIHDPLCQELQHSVGSDCTLCSQDENLLKLVMFNACSSTFWNVIGHAMDFDAVNMLEKSLLEEHMTLHSLQNVWAVEVFRVNPLAQAKALFQDLQSDQLF